MAKGSPIFEDVRPTHWMQIPVVECPECGSTYQALRNLYKAKNCKCGQLFWRSVKDELLDKLGSQSRVEQFLKKLEELGFIYPMGGADGGDLTPAARLVLAEPIAFSDAIADGTEDKEFDRLRSKYNKW